MDQKEQSIETQEERICWGCREGHMYYTGTDSQNSPPYHEHKCDNPDCGCRAYFKEKYLKGRK